MERIVEEVTICVDLKVVASEEAARQRQKGGKKHMGQDTINTAAWTN